MKRLLLLAALPLPIFSAPGLPVPVWTKATVVVESQPVHTGTPTVRPRKLTHTYRTTAHQQRCAMCLGQHLRNYHGEQIANLDKIGYRNWVAYHEQLHRPKLAQPKKDGGCAGGFCPTPRRPALLRDFFSRFRLR